MLYDNALLAVAYLESYQLTHNEGFRDVVIDILDYVEKEMTSPEGAFFSATDADSLVPSGHREEGYFFTWTPAELETILGPELTHVVKTYFSVGNVPNFEGRHILHMTQSSSMVARTLGLSESELTEKISSARKKLYAARQKRPAPLRDDKILTAWNGLMISAFARAGFVLNRRDYISRGATAARFIMTNMTENGRLRRSYKDGKARHNAYLADYAFFIAGLLDLYETQHDPQWINAAVAYDRVLEKHFEDKEKGGFFMTSDDHEKLLAREKPIDDGAIPSGNAVTLQNLVRLEAFFADDQYRSRADKAFTAFTGSLQNHPAALAEMLLAVEDRLDKTKEIVIVMPDGDTRETESFTAELKMRYLPNRILIVTNEKSNQDHEIPLAKDKTAIDGKATAYICEKGVCKLPVNTVEQFLEHLGK
jgi:uncharacterized protein YyaL (SSP411 family)